MKTFLAFAAAFALSVTAASAQTNPQSTPTPTGGSVSPQSSPPAQPPGSIGTLPSSNTQPAGDAAVRTGTTDRSTRRTKEMKKPRDKKKMKSTTTSGSSY